MADCYSLPSRSSVKLSLGDHNNTKNMKKTNDGNCYSLPSRSNVKSSLGGHNNTKNTNNMKNTNDGDCYSLPSRSGGSDVDCDVDCYEIKTNTSYHYDSTFFSMEDMINNIDKIQLPTNPYCFQQNKAYQDKINRLSEEQKDIIETLLNPHNIRVVAKAGSGKTSTSIVSCGKYYEKFQQKAIILTYNSLLKESCREELEVCEMSHIVDAHSYHAAAFSYFIKDATNIDHRKVSVETVIEEACARSPTNPSQLKNYSLLIIDEIQDMNEQFYEFSLHLLSFMSPSTIIMIMGDPFQRIFDYLGADLKYIQDPDHYFGKYLQIPNKEFIKKHMSICWRLTPETAHWINTYLNPTFIVDDEKYQPFISEWWGQGIKAPLNKPSHPDSIEYISSNYNNRKIALQCEYLFTLHGNANVALLGYSLGKTQNITKSQTGKNDTAKGSTPLTGVINMLSKQNHENWLILKEDTRYRKDIANRKRTASTIHKFKGLEKDVIVFIGLDSFIEKIKNGLDHFNLMYVACTRARKKLIIYKGYEKNLEYITIRQTKLPSNKKDKITVGVKELISHCPFEKTLSVGQQLFDVLEISKETKMDTPLISNTSNISNTSSLTNTEDMKDMEEISNILLGKIQPVDLSSFYFIPGREKETVEDIARYIGSAVDYKIAYTLQGSLPILDIDMNESWDIDMVSQSEYISLKIIENNKVLSKNSSSENVMSPLSWKDFIQYAVIRETIHTNLKNSWRQIRNYDSFVTDALILKLNICFENTIFMLGMVGLREKVWDINTIIQTLNDSGCNEYNKNNKDQITEREHNSEHHREHHNPTSPKKRKISKPNRRPLNSYPWIHILISLLRPICKPHYGIQFMGGSMGPKFLDIYSSKISGEIDILMDNRIIIELKCSKSMSNDYLLQVQIYTSVLSLLYDNFSFIPIVLNPCLGSLHYQQLKVLPWTEEICEQYITKKETLNHYNFLWRIIQRKCQNASLDKEFLWNCFSDFMKEKSM
jgi:hypothetical protein